MKKTIKQVNAIGAGISYLSSILFNKSIIIGMPPSAGIEITNYCNLKCPECSSGSGSMDRTRGFMEVELYDKFISEAGAYLYNISLYFQGEPMLHPRFFSFIEKKGKSNIIVSTNGHFLSRENNYKLVRSGISKLIISLDGMDNETYSRYRVNGDFEKVNTGIRTFSRELAKVKSSLRFEIQFLVNSFNESQIPLAKKFAKEVNASLKLKSMQVINKTEIEKWMPVNEKFRRYTRNRNKEFVPKNSFDNHCLRLWMNPVITWDGKVIPCCFDKNADHIMGDLNKSTFREIWHSENYKDFRNSVLTGREGIEICRNCTSGLKTV